MLVLGITADSWTAPIPLASPFPLAAWHSAFWAADPAWGHPVDGAPVTTWRDGSNNGHTLTSTGGPLWRATASVLNGCSAVEFDGVNDDMTTGTFPQVLSPFELVVVACSAKTSGLNHWAVGMNENAEVRINNGVWETSCPGGNVYGGTADTSRHFVRYHGEYGPLSFLDVDGIRIGGPGWATNSGPTQLRLAMKAAWAAEWTPIHVAFFGIKASTFTTTEIADLLAWSRSMYATP